MLVKIHLRSQNTIGMCTRSRKKKSEHLESIIQVLSSPVKKNVLNNVVIIPDRLVKS